MQGSVTEILRGRAVGLKPSQPQDACPDYLVQLLDDESTIAHDGASQIMSLVHQNTILLPRSADPC